MLDVSQRKNSRQALKWARDTWTDSMITMDPWQLLTDNVPLG
jgi:hypothetical protein